MPAGVRVRCGLFLLGWGLPDRAGGRQSRLAPSVGAVRVGLGKKRVDEQGVTVVPLEQLSRPLATLYESCGASPVSCCLISYPYLRFWRFVPTDFLLWVGVRSLELGVARGARASGRFATGARDLIDGPPVHGRDSRFVLGCSRFVGVAPGLLLRFPVVQHFDRECGSITEPIGVTAGL